MDEFEEGWFTPAVDGLPFLASDYRIPQMKCIRVGNIVRIECVYETRDADLELDLGL